MPNRVRKTYVEGRFKPESVGCFWRRANSIAEFANSIVDPVIIICKLFRGKNVIPIEAVGEVIAGKVCPK